MVKLELDELYECNEELLNDDQAIEHFVEMAKLMGSKLIPFRDQHAAWLTALVGDVRGWRIKGEVKFYRIDDEDYH
jgi:hypothetical protein